MKKEYKKPSIFIEDFKVNEYIAGSCAVNGPGYVTHTYHRSDCWIDVGSGVKIFNDYPCNINMEEMEENDKTCYHIPLDIAKYFAS